MEVDAWDVQGLLPVAQPAPRQSYTPMAGKPVPSTPVEPGTCHIDLSVEK